MKGKIVVILLLIAFLVFTVSKMMEYENEIRQDHIIKLFVEDESKPLFEKKSYQKLEEIAELANYNFKAENTYFKTFSINNSKWNNIFLKGVNLGVAIPGKFPAEFSLSFDEYIEWFTLIGKMNVNVIRIYTIFPPEFYKAFAYYNLNNSDKPIYLMHGVWAKVPKDEDYFNISYNREFQKEIIDVIDVIHGKAVIKAQQGKAHGVYVTDISKYIIGVLLGREWEPKGVFKTIKKNNISRFEGEFISINDGNAMEVWLTKMLNFTALYETQTYKQQHPLSFVNWLPLDPMFHNTEFIEKETVREYDNDLNSIDFEKFQTTPLFHTGIYAAYHVYPYYPDYINLKDSYVNTLNKEGEKNNYFGYLKDLKNHCKGMPLIIAEYGLPSSRGLSHFSPSGYHQGGHSEEEQAKFSLELTKSIYDTDCAGAIYFEWVDEWFKHNWLVMDFEVPFEDRKIWHNMENPEQNFGVVALESIKPKMEHTDNEKLVTAANPSYFYLSAKLKDFDFNKNNIYIAFDTYDKEKGDHKLPFIDEKFENGFEFLCSFKSPQEAKIQVDEPYSVFTDIYNDFIPVYSSKKNDNAIFIDELLLVNRGRESLTGQFTDSIVNNRSKLVFGDKTQSKFSNADWNWSDSSDQLTLQLTWHLLNVSDPAKKMVLDDKASTRAIEASKTEGFNIYMFVTDKNDNVLYQYPEDKPYFATWEDWENPEFTQRLKPVYDTLKNYFYNLKAKEETDLLSLVDKDVFSITNFYKGKKGAVSISFDNAMYSQYEFAYPILNKYEILATYSVTPQLIKNVVASTQEYKNTSFKTMGIKELKVLQAKDNNISWQFFDNDETTIKQRFFDPKSSRIHRKNSNFVPKNMVFVRESASDKSILKTFKGIHYTLMPLNISQVQLDSLLKTDENKWFIFVYHNLVKNKESKVKLSSNIPTIQQDIFERQIRIMRNADYLFTTELNAFKYLKEKQNSKVIVKKYGKSTYLTAKNELDNHIFNHPLTIEYKTSAKKIKITGSASDGIYSNRTGKILFDVYPNKEVELEILEY